MDYLFFLTKFFKYAFIFSLIVSCITTPFLIAFFVIGLWKFYEKSGRNGWEGMIPFYNTWVLCRISGSTSYWAKLIILLRIVNLTLIGIKLSFNIDIYIFLYIFNIVWVFSLVAKLVIYYNLSKKFHIDILFVFLLINLQFIMLSIIGISKRFQYDDGVLVDPNGFLGENYFICSTDNRVLSKKLIKKLKFNFKNLSDDDIKICHFCGAELHKKRKVCINCGEKMK